VKTETLLLLEFVVLRAFARNYIFGFKTPNAEVHSREPSEEQICISARFRVDPDFGKN
jgi:hypothetical protein